MEHLRITVQGQVYDVIVEKIERNSPPLPAANLAPPPAPPAMPAAAVTPPAPTQPKATSTAISSDALSPLAGIVQAIEAKVGTVVEEGALVITLEAMKMYTPINATTGGTITAIHVQVGDAVDEGQALYSIV